MAEPNYAAEFQEKQREVNNKLNMGSAGDALKAVLANPPLGCKEQSIRDQTLDLVISVLTQIKEGDIDRHVNGLNDDELDVLMKYVYKGLESGDNSNSLLKWHAGATKKGGLGCIVRAIAERRTI
ncbi:Actin-related protein 2/3 complex subunit 5 [Balamuthia mandrillaris]